MVVNRFLRLGLLLLLALLLLPAGPGLGAGRSSARSVTIGLLPPTTRASEVVVRGTAPTDSIVLIAVNGQVASRQMVGASLAVYWGRVRLEPGRNWITVRVEGSPLMARTMIHRLTANLPELADDPLRTDFEIMATLGLLPSGGLRPAEPLTRAELDALLQAGGLPAPAGLPAGGESQPVSRGELIAAAIRALPAPLLDPDAIRQSNLRRLNRPVPPSAAAPSPRAVPLPFSDATRIPAGVGAAAEAAVQRGLVDSFWGSEFRADDPVTRREAVAVIRRLLDQASGARIGGNHP